MSCRLDDSLSFVQKPRENGRRLCPDRIRDVTFYSFASFSYIADDGPRL